MPYLLLTLPILLWLFYLGVKCVQRARERAAFGAACPASCARAPVFWRMHTRMRRYFLRTSRQVKQLDALSRSPLFSHLQL